MVLFAGGVVVAMEVVAMEVVVREVAAVRVEADCCAGGGEAVPSLTERDPEGEVGALSS